MRGRKPIGLILVSAFSAILVYAQERMPGKIGMISGTFFGFAFGRIAVLRRFSCHRNMDGSQQARSLSACFLIAVLAGCTTTSDKLRHFPETPSIANKCEMIDWHSGKIGPVVRFYKCMDRLFARIILE